MIVKRVIKVFEESVGKLLHGEEKKLYDEICKLIKEKGFLMLDEFVEELKPKYKNLRKKELRKRIQRILSKMSVKKVLGIRPHEDENNYFG